MDGHRAADRPRYGDDFRVDSVWRAGDRRRRPDPGSVGADRVQPARSHRWPGGRSDGGYVIRSGRGFRLSWAADAKRLGQIRRGHYMSQDSEEHKSELQSIMRITYAVFRCKK